MPYITQKEREELDPIIDQLHERCQFIRGRINYCCTRLIHLWCIARMDVIKSTVKKYNIVNDAHGILNCIASEFYNAVVFPYEILKRKENGSVSRLDEFADGKPTRYKCDSCGGTFKEPRIMLPDSVDTYSECPSCGSGNYGYIRVVK